MEYGAVLHSTLPEGMKFTRVVFSCKQYVDIVACTCESPGTCTQCIRERDSVLYLGMAKEFSNLPY